MIKIMADSTCDLSAEVVSQYNIGIAPLKFNINRKTYQDKIDLTINGRKCNTAPATVSAIAITDGEQIKTFAGKNTVDINPKTII